MNRLKHFLPLCLCAIAILLSGCEAITNAAGNKNDPAPAPAVTGVTLDRTSVQLRVNETFTLKASVTPASASSTSLVWSTSDARIATVSQGLVTTKKAGRVTITASAEGNVSAKCEVTCADLLIFSISDEFASEGVIDDFEALTGKKVALEIESNDRYLSALKKRFASGVGIPDLFVGEAGFIKEVVGLGQSEDLEASPYSAVTTDQYSYAAQLGKDAEGHLRALSWQATPGGLFYRRSIAKAVFGSDDPAVIGEKFASWSAALNSGKALVAAGYTVLPDVSDLGNVFFAAKSTPYFDASHTYKLDPVIKTYFETAKSLRDAKADSQVEAWTAPWMDGMNTAPSKAKIFSYLLPTWGLFFVLNGQTNSKGDWAVTSGPMPWYWGGTWLNIYQGSPAANKTLAWQFVKRLTLDPDYMETLAKRTGDFVNNKTVVNKLKGSMTNAVLGGQNHYAFFAQEAEKINADGVSAADTVVNHLVNDVLKDYLSGKLATVKSSLAEVTDRVKLEYPNAVYPPPVEWFLLTNDFLGSTRFFNTYGGTVNEPFMGTGGRETGEFWQKVPAGNGKFKLSNYDLGVGRSLETNGAGKALLMGTTRDTPAQLWHQVSTGNGTFLLINDATGENQALDTRNDGVNDPFMNTNAGYSGQAWTFVPVVP